MLTSPAVRTLAMSKPLCKRVVDSDSYRVCSEHFTVERKGWREAMVIRVSLDDFECNSLYALPSLFFSTPPGVPFIPSTFSILLSFHAHMHDFKFLYNNLEVTMREHSGYLSFWDWFNSLNRSISTCICFPTKNTNQHFKFLWPVYWHFLQRNVNLWSQGSLGTCPFLSV